MGGQAVTDRVDPTRSQPASNDPLAVTAPQRTLDSGLPLLLVTFGDDEGEFEALYDRLNALERDENPRYQSLIVARPGVSEVVLRVLSARVRELPHVHLRKLGRKPRDCAKLAHETGSFYVDDGVLREED